MPTTALLLILLSAFTHAVWNALLKRQPSPQQATIGLTVYCALSSLVAAGIRGAGAMPALAWRWSVGAGLFETAYFYALGLALESAPLSTVYPLSRGAAVILVWPLSMSVAHEALTLMTALGAVAVVVGLSLTGGGLAAPRTRTGVLAALGAAVFIAFNHVSYKEGMAAGGPPAEVFATAMTVAAMLSLLRLGPVRLRAARTAGVFGSPRVMGVGALAAVSFLLALGALQSTGAGAVLTLRNLSIPFAVLLGAAGGERPSRRQIMGASLVTAGAVLISL